MSVQSFRNHRLYCILDLDLPYLKGNPLCIAKDLITGGADIIQLRTKSQPVKYVIKIGEKIRSLATRHKIIFIINDRLDLTLALGADGVHLGQEDLEVSYARRLLGKDKIIGLSTHSIKQARIAQDYNIDYISIGPIFRSPTKPKLKPIGLDILRKVSRISKIPIVAIGGINTLNLEKVLENGAHTIAVISAVLNSYDIKKRTREFKIKINNFYKEHDGEDG